MRTPAHPRTRTLARVWAATLATGGLTMALLAAPATAAPASTAVPLDLATAGVAEVEAGLAAGDFTSVELTLAYLERIDALSVRGPHLNAVRSVNPAALAEAAALDAERAAGTVRGALHGVPVLVKDNIDVAGMPTTAGSVALASSYPAGDAPLVTQLREAGAVILGKTNLSEFANYLTTGMPGGYSSLGGQVLNPYDVSQSPSGSSSGSGSAGAAGLATLTIGTETSGSILSPSRANSLVGVKPTVGLVSRTGIIPISASQDTAGPMTRTVDDAAVLLSAMTAVDPEDVATTANPSPGIDYRAALSETSLEGARIGYVANDDAVYTAALETLEEEGAELVPVSVGNTSAPNILAMEFERDLNAYLARLPEGSPMRTLSDIIAYNLAHADVALKFGQARLLESEAYDLTDPAQLEAYETARDQGLAETRAAIDSVLEEEGLDAIVSNSATTGVGARAGYPSVIVPAGYDATTRRPVGLSFLGTAWTEAELLSLAYDFEQAAEAWLPPEVVNPTLFRCTDLTPPDEWADSCADVDDAEEPQPTEEPTEEPTVDPEPTEEPTVGPEPTGEPTDEPTTPAEVPSVDATDSAGSPTAPGGRGAGSGPAAGAGGLASTGAPGTTALLAVGLALLVAGAVTVPWVRRRTSTELSGS